MNDNDQASDHDVLCAVSDSLSRVPATRPPQLEAVMARGRARQRRRRASGMAAVAAVAAVAAAVTVLPAGSRPAGPVASPSASARLAAWTVTRAGGDIRVTVSELSNPAGLQRTLRADGVPASVTFLSQQDPACRPLGTDPGLLGKIFPGRPAGTVHHLPGGTTLGTGGKAGADMAIDAAAIPSGVGLQLGFFRLDRSTPGQFVIVSRAALVHASQQCTGS